MATKRLAIVAALVALLGLAASAYASNCTTTCYRNAGGGQTCNTWCT
jgi:hypothetical protein